MTAPVSDIRSDMRAYVERNFLYMNPGTQLEDDGDLLGLGIIDSLGFVELVEEVQSRYGLVVPDVDITEENFGSIEAIERYVTGRQAES